MNIYQALSKALEQMPALTKDAENKHFKHKYLKLSTLLEIVNPVLRKHNILFTSSVRAEDYILEATLVLADNQSEKISTSIPLIGCTDMQKLGSAITYARRYGLLMLLGEAEDDDDGNIACNQAVTYMTQPSSNVLLKTKIKNDFDKHKNLLMEKNKEAANKIMASILANFKDCSMDKLNEMSKWIEGQIK